MKKGLLLILLAVFGLAFCGCRPTKEVPKDLPPLPLPEEGPVGAGGDPREPMDDGGGRAEPAPAAGGSNRPAPPAVDPTKAPPTDQQKNVPAKGKKPPSAGKEF